MPFSGAEWKSKQKVHANMTMEIEIVLNFHEFKDRANRSYRLDFSKHELQGRLGQLFIILSY